MRPGFYTRKSDSAASAPESRPAGAASMRPGFYTRKSLNGWSMERAGPGSSASMRPGFYTRKSNDHRPMGTNHRSGYKLQ